MGEVGENNQMRTAHSVQHPTTLQTVDGIEVLVRRADKQFLGDIRQVMAFTVAVTGLISAACLSGLPSTACYALADAYAVSLFTLSLIFALSVAIFYALTLINMFLRFTRSRTRLEELIFKTTFFLTILGTASCLIILLEFAVRGAINIQAAINHCYLGDEKVQQSNLHARIPLYRNPFSSHTR